MFEEAIIEIILTNVTFFAVVFLFAVTMTATPGPNNIMLLTSSLNYGVKKTIPHGMGIICGVPVMVGAIGLGLGQVFESYPVIHKVIKVLGISYLLYLAWKIAMTDASTNAIKSTKPLTFMQAALFQWVNPKTWVMSVGAISAFTTIGSNVSLQIVIIALSFLAAATTSTSIWVCCGYLLNRILNNNFQRKVFNIVMGLLLVASVLPIISLKI